MARKPAAKKKSAKGKVAKKSAASRKRVGTPSALDRVLDEELEESFPASDPPALTDPGHTGRPRRS